ncbi:hypothetical protein VTP01DRAFT_6908 [Rhizomucor pusillus]|uniref:60S ribosomal protein eL24 n=1 Tax=Rhizomucor pusillus TaxID=4840 RepID=UPI003742059A
MHGNIPSTNGILMARDLLIFRLQDLSCQGQGLRPQRQQTFRFINGKAESLFLQRLNPRKIRWTQIYRRLNKKGVTEEVAKKRSRRTVKHERAIAGLSWDAIRAKREETPAARAAARQAAKASAVKVAPNKRAAARK